MKDQNSSNPLHGITLEKIVNNLVGHFGWDELGQRININCFQQEPSVKSSLKFLRKTDWARKKVEDYPNPFNPETTISFSIPENSKVNLEIYNTREQKVKTLINKDFEKSIHNVNWNSKDDYGKSVASGIYFYKLNVNGKTKVLRKCYF